MVKKSLQKIYLTFQLNIFINFKENKNTMKKLTFLFTLIFFGMISAQENFELTTLRIGAYKIFMKADDAEKLAQKKLQIFEEWEKSNSVSVNGEKIEIKLQNTYISEKEPSKLAIYSLSTKSAKFRTKSGIGVGSTKDELIVAYKNYPNFSVHQGWDDKGENRSKTISYFNLSDSDAATELSFKLENNIVTEVSVYINEGC